MVPHRQAIRAVALVCSVRADGRAYESEICSRIGVSLPYCLDDILESEIYPYLSPALETLLRTTDVSATQDVKSLLYAASVLEVSDIISLEADGPSVRLSPAMEIWRRDRTRRVFIETCLLAGISATQIAEDMRRMWGADVNETEVRRFGELFCDRDYLQGNGWFEYTTCIGEEEAQFKIGLITQPHVFVRWKLGAPVSPDVDLIMDRIIADSYFTERVIKGRAGENGVNLGRDELARVKLERDTLFKAIDRRMKMKQVEAETGGGGDAKAAAKLLREIVLDMEDHEFPLAAEILGSGADMPLIEELEGD